MDLTVTALRGTNIIVVSYTNRDPELATLVLKELVTRYFTKHLEVHRSADAFNFVSQQSDEVRARLRQTEDELKQIKDKVGITSLAASNTNLNAELARTREALKAAEAEEAEQQAMVREMEKPLQGRNVKPQDAAPGVNGEIIQQYQSIIARLAALRQLDLELVSKYAQKTEQPDALDEIKRTRQIRPKGDLSTPATQIPQLSRNFREFNFVGAERDQAQCDCAREVSPPER